jgi:hypothetical protein
MTTDGGEISDVNRNKAKRALERAAHMAAAAEVARRELNRAFFVLARRCVGLWGLRSAWGRGSAGVGRCEQWWAGCSVRLAEPSSAS